MYVRAISSTLRNNRDMELRYVIASRIFYKKRQFALFSRTKKFINLFLIICSQGSLFHIGKKSATCCHGCSVVHTYCFLSRPRTYYV